MARLEVTGVDEMIAGFTHAGSQMRSIIAEALRQSAEVVHAELLKQESKFKAPTGELGKTIADDGPKHAASASYIELLYKGDYRGSRGGGEKKGGHAPRRAGFVAAMQEHKNGNPFNQRAMRSSKKRINSIIAEHMDISKGWGGL